MENKRCKAVKAHISVLVFSIGFLYCCVTNAQDEQEQPKAKPVNNSITLSVGSFNIPGLTFGWHPLRLPGASLSRRVYRNLWIDGGYARWENYRTFDRDYYLHRADGFTNPQTGDILIRNNYQMVDLSLQYLYNIRQSHHSVFLGLGSSVIWGKNDMIDFHKEVYWPFAHSIITTYVESVTYVGLYNTLGYEYRFLNQHMGVGCSFTSRNIFSDKIIQYDISLNVSVSF